MFLRCVAKIIFSIQVTATWHLRSTAPNLEIIEEGILHPNSFCPQMKEYRFSLRLNVLNSMGKSILDEKRKEIVTDPKF